MHSTTEERFTAAYRSHWAAVERYVMRRAPADAVADIVAEVFLTAWRKADGLPEAGTLPWLYGVARRVLANDRRARQRRVALAELLAAQPWREEHSGEEEVIVRTDLAQALSGLSENDQEVLRLTLWEDLTAGEAAIVLGRSAVAVRVRLHRARQRLRRCLEVETAAPLPVQATPTRQEATHAQR